MNKLFTLVMCLMLCCFGTMNAQRNCGSMDHLHQQIQQNPDIQNNLDRLEDFTKDYSQLKAFANGIVTIPIIVHVVYNSSAGNISDSQIQSQINVLNDDFRRMNGDQSNTPSDFIGVASDTEIEFCLTQVIRKSTSVSSFGTNDSVKSAGSGGSNAITPSQALNFWVCNIGGGILGYAQFPGGSASTDGVVVDYRYFGTNGTATAPFDLGRTATHEVGHWLNLRHIWGDGGCNADDFVSDTPKAGAPNYTSTPCSYPGPNTCKPKGRPGQPDDFDMFQNYMDYSDDACMNLFTIGQKDRMWAALSGSRSSFLTATCDGNPPAVEICDNGIDDDGDGAIDCDDSDCSGDPSCDTTPTAEICDNGIDDDGDGAVDCDDSDCSGDSVCDTDPGSCDAPSGLTHTRRKGGREARLDWNAASGATSYFVEVYNDSGTLIASGTVGGTTANISGLSKNRAYTWRVRSICSTSTSDWANSSFNARVAGNKNFSEALITFPNPANDVITIEWNFETDGIVKLSEEEIISNGGQVNISIFNMSGSLQSEISAIEDTGSIDINVSQFSEGVYYIKASNENGQSSVSKLIKN